MREIKVSVLCEVYNHGPYLRDCLEGFVMQKTTFPFEILVHDDASTDCSADIIREYEEKYPNLFKPIYQTENQYSKGINIWFSIQFPRAKGKYIALCEGDDYWIDPLKLQKQVDFLEQNERYGLCCSASRVFNQEEQRFVGVKGSSLCEKYETIIQGFNDINTATALFRTDLLRRCVIDLYSFLPGELLFDTALWYWFSYYGFVRFLAEELAVYRVLPESACHTKDEQKQIDFDLRFLKLKLFFLSRYHLNQGEEKDVIDDLDRTIREICNHSGLLGEKRVRDSKSYRIGHLIKTVSFWKRHM